MQKLKNIKPMRTLLSFFTLLFVLLVGCSETPIDEYSLAEPTSNASSDYNETVRDLALALAKSLNESPELGQIIKEEVMLMYDDDYDVLLSTLADRKLTAPNSIQTRSKDGKCRVADIIEANLPINKTRAVSDTTTYLAVIRAQYPDMQVSVPVHADTWDPALYQPPVAFLEDTYDDDTTEFIRAVTLTGKELTLSTSIEPPKPVIVISPSERYNMTITEPNPVAPNAPQNLVGCVTESGIQLLWDMPSGYSSSNVSGYYVYRKDSDESEFKHLASIHGYSNRVYNDNSVVANKTYYYYIIAQYQGLQSEMSNIVSVTAPAINSPVATFSAKQITLNSVELQWTNINNQYNPEIRLYKRVGEDSEYVLFKTFTNNETNYIDTDVAAGQCIVYKICNVSNQGESEAKYDIVHVTYRSPYLPSPVYIKQIRFDSWKLERWPAGKPEFYIKLVGVDRETHTTYEIVKQMELKFDKRKTKISQVFTNKKIYDWLPVEWFDAITFSVEEYDRIRLSVDFELNGEIAVKSSDKKALTYDFGAKIKVSLTDGGQDCGESTLFYYQDPNQWLQFDNYGLEILISDSDN